MTIVVDKSGNTGPADGSYYTHKRSNAGTPNGAVTPLFAGEIVWDTTNKVRWKAVGITNADWTPMAAEVT
jgi:hypothetical protein